MDPYPVGLVIVRYLLTMWADLILSYGTTNI